tara:strand:- start:70 stop:1695 length:1626 start_codon:yes stop_codon:yes gene_type:complete
MTVNGKSRRSYKGAPVSNTLGGSGLALGATSITLATAISGWSTSGTPFFVVVDPGTTTEEKLCVIYAAPTILTVVDPAVTSAWGPSVAGRGVDDTTDRAHDVGAVIYPVFTAAEANHANELVSKYANAGSVVYQGSGTPGTFTELAVGTAGQALKVNAGATAPEWGQLAAAGIADGAVTSAKILNGTIVDADVNAAAAIALSKLATGDLPSGIKVLSANLTDLTIVEADLADGAVTSAKIANGTIVDADINAAAAIALSKLATGALPSGITVASANLTDLTIATADLANDAVTAAKIAANAVGTSEIANDSVTADKVADGATLPVNITGNAATASSASSASSASYATSAGDAYEANRLDDGGNLIYFGAGSWNSQQVHYFNAGLNVTSGSAIFNGNIYLPALGPSSADKVLVDASGLLKYRTLSPWSLREMKEEIEPLNDALSKVEALQPKTFRFKEDVLIADEPFDAFNRREQLQYGFIVDEVESSETPDLVAYGSQDGIGKYIQSWKIDGVVSLAIGAIKELSAKVNTLESRITQLENQ